jgi:hypothetical protein
MPFKSNLISKKLKEEPAQGLCKKEEPKPQGNSSSGKNISEVGQDINMNEYIDSLCKKVRITDSANWHKFEDELERDIKRIKVSQEKEAESYDPESLLKLDDKKPKIYDIFKLVADIDAEMTRQEKAGTSLVSKGKVEDRIPFKKLEGAATDESGYGLCEIPNDLRKKAKEIERLDKNIKGIMNI